MRCVRSSRFAKDLRRSAAARLSLAYFVMDAAFSKA
jgi:hypothetical protein